MFDLPPKVTRQQLEKQPRGVLVDLVLAMQDNWLAADAAARQQDAMLLGAAELIADKDPAKKLPPWLTKVKTDG